MIAYLTTPGQVVLKRDLGIASIVFLATFTALIAYLSN